MTDRLLSALEGRANRDGLVLARDAALREELGVGLERLRLALRALEDAGQIRLLSPLPYLALKLLKWPGHGRERAKNQPAANSYSFQQSADERKAIAAEDGGAGEGDALLQEILVTLGETNPTSFRGALEHYPAPKIRAVLDRVRATPPVKVRKSRTALFRYLLAKTK